MPFIIIVDEKGNANSSPGHPIIKHAGRAKVPNAHNGELPSGVRLERKILAKCGKICRVCRANFLLTTVYESEPGERNHILEQRLYGCSVSTLEAETRSPLWIPYRVTHSPSFSCIWNEIKSRCYKGKTWITKQRAKKKKSPEYRTGRYQKASCSKHS